MPKKVKHSAFSTPWPIDQLVRISPPPLHIPVYSTGGLKQLYNSINDGGENWLQDYGKFTDQKGVFTPKVGMPLLAARYRYLELLGHGQSSVLIKAEDTFNSDRKVSIKVLHTNYCILGPQEVDCLRKLSFADPEGYSSVIRLQNIFMFEEHYCMVFELLDPKPLTAHLKKITCKHERLKAVRKITLQLLQALGFLQQQNVIHADLKPDNILLKNENDFSCLKIIDLGNAIHCVYDELSLYYDDFQLQTFLYRAPEVMYGMPFGLAVDMWSLGCILAELYKGEPLFFGRTQKMVLTKITGILGPVPQMYQKGKFFHSLQSFAGPPTTEDVVLLLMEEIGTSDYTFADFISRLLRYDPAERMTISEAAQHQFMAPELAMRFLLPQQHGLGKDYGYPRIHLTTDSYQHAPTICSDVTKLQLSSLELLRYGTKKPPTNCTIVAEPPMKKVAQIMPTVQRPKPGNVFYSSSTSATAEHQHNPSVHSAMGTGVITVEQTLASGTPKGTWHYASNHLLPRLMTVQHGSRIQIEKDLSIAHPHCSVSRLRHIIRASVERMDDAHNGRSCTGISQIKSQSSRRNLLAAPDDMSHVKATGCSQDCSKHKIGIHSTAQQQIDITYDKTNPHRVSTPGTGMTNLPNLVSSRNSDEHHFVRESDLNLQINDVNNGDKKSCPRQSAEVCKDMITVGCKQRVIQVEPQHESNENLEDNIASITHSSSDSAVGTCFKSNGLFLCSPNTNTRVIKQNADPSSQHQLVKESVAGSEASSKQDVTRQIQNWLHSMPEVHGQLQNESLSDVPHNAKTAQGISPTVPDVIKPMQCGSSRMLDVAKPIQNASPTMSYLTQPGQNELYSWPDVTEAVQNGSSTELTQTHFSDVSNLYNDRQFSRRDGCHIACATDTFGKKLNSQVSSDSTGGHAQNKKRKHHSSTHRNKLQNRITQKRSVSPGVVGDTEAEKSGPSLEYISRNNKYLKGPHFGMGSSFGTAQKRHHTETPGFDSLFSQSASSVGEPKTSLHPVNDDDTPCPMEAFLEKNESKHRSTDTYNIKNIKRESVGVSHSDFVMSSSSSDCSLNVISDDCSSENSGWFPSAKQTVHKTAMKMNCPTTIDGSHEMQMASLNEQKPQIRRETLGSIHRGTYNLVKEDPNNSICDQVSGIFYRKSNHTRCLKRMSKYVHMEMDKHIKLKGEILQSSNSDRSKCKDNQMLSVQTGQHNKYKQESALDKTVVITNHTKFKSVHKSLDSNVKMYNSSGKVNNGQKQQGTSKVRKVTTAENRIRKRSLCKSRNRKQISTMTSAEKKPKSTQQTATSSRYISPYPDVSEYLM